MINNNDYLEKTRKANDKIVFQYLYPFLFLAFLFVSPVAVILFTIVFTPIFYLLFYKKIEFSRSLLNFSFVLYLIISLIYSCLPSLQLESFKITHPNWVKVDGKIIDYNVKWNTTTKTSAASSVADVKYSYKINKNLIVVNEIDAISFYSNKLWNNENDKSKLSLELQTKVQNIINSNKYEIWISTENESKIFIPLDMLSSKTSFNFQFLIIILKCLITLLFIIFLPNIFTNIKKFVKK